MSQTARSSVKDRILEAAKDEFSQAGVSKVTMEEIAERAGMGKASIYYYFRTKDALLKAVILREYEEFSRRLEEILPTKTSAADKLRAYEEKRFSYFNKLMAFKLVELAPSLKVKPALLDMFDEFARREMKLIRRVIQEGKDNGEFDIVSVDRIARAFLHLVRGLRLCRIREARGKRIGPETLAQLRRELDLVTGIFLRGIAGTARLAPAARSAMSRPRAGPSRHVAPHPAPRDQAVTKPRPSRDSTGPGRDAGRHMEQRQETRQRP